MLPTSMQIQIRTPEKEVYTGKITKIGFRSELGDLEVFPGHADMATAIQFSPISLVDEQGTEEHFIGKRGIAHISNSKNEIHLMLLDCQRTSELKEVSPAEYLQFVLEQLDKKADMSDFQVRFFEEEHHMLLEQKAHMEK